MLKAADIYEKNSNEWKTARDKIREDWKEEKITGIKNNNYNIDTSGSKPSAPKDTVKPGDGGDNNNNNNNQSSTSQSTGSSYSRPGTSNHPTGHHW